MTAHSGAAPVPRLALSVSEAARSLGVSVDYLTEHISPELRWIRRGRKRVVAVAELERWLDENAERPVVEEVAPARPFEIRRKAAA